MDWENLKAAEEHAPDPIHHQPAEAPIISEDEAQVVESPEDQEGTDEKGGIVDKVLDNDDESVPEDSVRARPHHDKDEA